MSKLPTHIVTEDESGIRLDRWFKRHFPDVTHGQLQKLLRTGQVRVAGKRAEANARLESGQEVRVPPQVATPTEALVNEQDERRNDQIAKKLKKLILFEDDDVIVFNKPAGLAVQGGTGLKENMDDMLRAFAGDGKAKPKLVHRLDRDTSGVFVVARTDYAATKLAAAFRDRTTQKIYWGLTLGVPKIPHGKISAPLVKHGEIMVVDTDDSDEAKSATTIYQTVESVKGQGAFVAMWPVTGRTHQLRVHMAHIGNPLLGDPLYATDAVTNLPLGDLGKGLHLHARRLIMPHPRRSVIDVKAPLGDAMRQTWDWFGFNANDTTNFDDV